MLITFSLTSILVATALILCMPCLATSTAVATSHSIPIINNPLGDQGDGRYVLTWDENREGTVEFTAMADLNLPPVAVNNSAIFVRERKLEERTSVTCGAGLLVYSDITTAANCLADYAQDNPSWGYHEWVWVCVCSAINSN
jgi:hypothetical protein